MRRDFLQEEPLENPEINLTPLIDVVFVILIMFIVVVPLLEMDRVELANSSVIQEKNSPITESAVTLHVYHDNSLMLNGKIVTLEELPTFLAIERQLKGTKLLTLFHDKNGSFGTYQQVKQSAESVGFEELDVILKPN